MGNKGRKERQEAETELEGGIPEGKKEDGSEISLTHIISLNTLNYLRSLSVPPSRKSLIGSGESCGFLDHSCGIECA